MSPEDRLTDGYEPRFDRDYERGRQAEIFVDDIIDGLQTEAVEVKRDDRSLDTGNIYVEYRCKRNGRYRPSGISTTDAMYWVFVLEQGELAICVSTRRLKTLGRRAYKRGDLAEEEDGSHPTKGVLIGIDELALSGFELPDGGT